MNNPLLEKYPFPLFSKIEDRHIVPAVKKIINYCRTEVERILTKRSQYTWDNLCQPLSELDNLLNRTLSPITHLNAVRNNSNLRKSYKEILLIISNYNNWITKNKNLYKAYINLRNGEYYQKLDKAQKKLVDNILRDFKLSGIELSEEKRKDYDRINNRLAELSNNYDNNVLDATLNWTKLIKNKEELSGIPIDILKLAKIKAASKGEKGWLLTLDTTSYISIMTYCDNAKIREEIYYAYNTRASDQGPNAGKWDNSDIMHEILKLRYELAHLLGFKNYFDKSVVTKMADDIYQVKDFLSSLIKRIKPQAEKELNQLKVFVKQNFHTINLNSWDILYFSEKQKQVIYDINDEQIRPYFPVNKVINGLFKLLKILFDISIKEIHNIDVWHEDVRFFNIYNENNELMGGFYLDLYARENKRSGAWMDIYTNKLRKSDGSLQQPIAYLTCNFHAPIKGKQSLLNHNEIITIFHEFGHVLHHVMTKVEVSGVSGINGIPWDVIELSSQIMENWCWEPEVLNFISSHYETKEPLKENLINKIIKTKNYHSAIFILHQLELSLFDLRLHSEFDPNNKDIITEILNDVRKKVAVINIPHWNRFANFFNHIFSSGYEACYYSYLWANVLSSDLYSRFKNEGVLNQELGKSFIDDIISHGGSEEPIRLIKNFLGREPRIDSMLENYGIKN